jgi:hypothetical protein
VAPQYGCGNPSDELIDRTKERALSQIDAAKGKKRLNNLKLVILIFCCVVVALCLWVMR